MVLYKGTFLVIGVGIVFLRHSKRNKSIKQR